MFRRSVEMTTQTPHPVLAAAHAHRKVLVLPNPLPSLLFLLPRSLFEVGNSLPAFVQVNLGLPSVSAGRPALPLDLVPVDAFLAIDERVDDALDLPLLGRPVAGGGGSIGAGVPTFREFPRSLGGSIGLLGNVSTGLCPRHV